MIPMYIYIYIPTYVYAYTQIIIYLSFFLSIGKLVPKYL